MSIIKEIKVSIIVPVYNVGEFVEKCILSIVNQTLKDVEIIIVDDGSTDNTHEIIIELAQRHNNINVIKQSNCGQSEARNLGIRHAKGFYIGFVDGDDWIEPDMIEIMYNQAQKTKADIVICDALADYLDGKSVYLKSGNINENAGTPFVKKDLLVSVLPAVWNKLYKRSLFIDNNIYFPKDLIFEDLATTFKLLVKGKKIVKVDNAFYHYVQREGSIMRQYTSKIFDMYKIFDIINKFLHEIDSYKVYKDEYEYLLLGNGVFSMLMKIKNYDGDKLEALTKVKKIVQNELKDITQNPYYHCLTRNQKIYLFFIRKNIFIGYGLLMLSLKIRGDKNGI